MEQNQRLLGEELEMLQMPRCWPRSRQLVALVDDLAGLLADTGSQSRDHCSTSGVAISYPRLSPADPLLFMTITVFLTLVFTSDVLLRFTFSPWL